MDADPVIAIQPVTVHEFETMPLEGGDVLPGFSVPVAEIIS